MADVIINSSPHAQLAGIAKSDFGPFETSTSTAYMIIVDNSSDLRYEKTTDGGGSWVSHAIKAGTVFAYSCWAAWKTPGNAGTVIHIAYLDAATNKVSYVALDTVDDSLTYIDVETCQGTGTFNGDTGRLTTICITVATGGDIYIYSHYKDDSSAHKHCFYAYSVGSWVSKTQLNLYTSTHPQEYRLFPMVGVADAARLFYWSGISNTITMYKYSAGTNSWSSDVTVFDPADPGDYVHFQWSGAFLSTTYMVFAAWSGLDGTTRDILTALIKDDDTVILKTNVLTDTDHAHCVGLAVNPQNDRIYAAYVVGDDDNETVCSCKYSDDNMTTWSAEQTKQTDVADDMDVVTVGCYSSSGYGIFMPCWLNTDTDKLLTSGEWAINDIVVIDWNKDGDFYDAYESITSDVQSFRFKRGRDDDLDMAMIGECEIVVKDTTGKYVPESGGSSIVAAHGGIYPMCPIRIKWLLYGEYKDLFRGFLDDIHPDPGKMSREATIVGVDGMDQLAQRITLQIQSAKLSGELFEEALDSLGWSGSARDIDDGHEEYPITFAEELACKEFFENIARSEFGYFYVDEEGNQTWEDRTYRLLTSRCIVSQFTFTESKYTKLEPLHSLASVRNYIVFTAQHKTKAGALSDLWTLNENKDNATPDSPALSPGESIEYWAEFDNIADDVTAPTSTTDYLGNTAIDGSGSDKTSELTVTCGASDIFSQSAKITVTNNDSNTVYLTMLKIRGKIYADDPKTKIIEYDQDSIDNYGKRNLIIDLPYYVSVNFMRAMAQYILATRKDPHQRYLMTVVGSTDELISEIVNRKISDRITLQNTDLGIDNEFYIDKQEIDWRIGGSLAARYIVSKASDEQYWILGTSELGVDTRLGY